MDDGRTRYGGAHGAQCELRSAGTNIHEWTNEKARGAFDDCAPWELQLQLRDTKLVSLYKAGQSLHVISVSNLHE